jgi:peptide/nickel transport system substrate-binding protein
MKTIPTQGKGRIMRSRLRWAIVPGLLVPLALGLAACGSSGTTQNVQAEQAKFAPPTAPPSDAQKGGTLNVIAAGDVDYIDPGAAYYQFTYTISYATVRPLLAWQPDDVANPTPDLATGEPDVSNGDKTLTFHIQSGIGYSPPTGGGTGINRPVESKDVKYAIERTLLPGVSNGYEVSYFSDISGYDAAVAAVKKDPSKAPEISGIETPDATTVVFNLDRPVASVLLQALSLPASAPVPEEYAAKYDAGATSTYGAHQLDTGPYYVATYDPGKQVILKRNPNWDASTDWRPAYLDGINIQEGFTDTISAGKKILSGSDYINGDFGAPAEILKLAATKYPDQLTLTPTGGMRYVSMNTQSGVFKNINVRKAAIAISDRVALRQTRGGPLIGPIETHIIPPDFPGFDEAGGLKGPNLDYLQHPQGDPALAKSYMQKAGYPSGKCTGDCTVVLVGDNSPPGSDTAQKVVDQLSGLGLDVQFHAIDHAIMYTKFCQVPSNMPDACPNVGWLKDFNDPQVMLQPTFSGDTINAPNGPTYNYPLLDDPAINKAMKAAEIINDPAQRAAAWGKIDDDVMALAPVIPWVWDNEANVESKNVNGVVNLFDADWDFSYTSLAK